MTGFCTNIGHGECTLDSVKTSHEPTLHGCSPMPVLPWSQLSKMRRGREATISEDVNPSVGHPDFVAHTISPEFQVIKPSIYWHRIMFPQEWRVFFPFF